MPMRWAATARQLAKALLVAWSGRSRNCRWVHRRVIIYVRAGRTSRGRGIPTCRIGSQKVARKTNLGHGKENQTGGGAFFLKKKTGRGVGANLKPKTTDTPP